jgi:hypothetical protein
MPLFTNINSIGISNHNSDILVQLQNGYSELATPMLTSARLLLSELVSTSKLKHINNNHNFSFSVIIAGILGSATGFIFHGKMEIQEFCFLMVSNIMGVQFLVSSSTSKRSVKKV